MADSNRQLAIRWFEEVWNQRIDATIDQLMAPRSVGHMEGVDVVGPAEFKKVRAQLIEAFPDLRVKVEATVADGDNVIVRRTASGTHRGGLGIDPTNVPVTFRGMTWTIVKDGQFVEGWDSWNQGALIETLREAARAQSSQ